MIRKILGVLFISSSLLVWSTVNSIAADIGASIGITGAVGLYHANGQENEGTNDTNDLSEDIAVSYGAIFAELNMDRFTIGVQILPGAIETDTTSRTDTQSSPANAKETDLLSPASSSNNEGTSNVKAEFENFMTFYGEVDLWEGFYVTAGAMSVDVNTLESLHTSSSYGNATIDGTMVGLGFKRSHDNGVFVKFAAKHQDWDDINLTASGGNTITVKGELEGASVELSLGKSF
jgi:hypothetical protein